jgi:hypothetical protein
MSTFRNKAAYKKISVSKYIDLEESESIDDVIAKLTEMKKAYTTCSVGVDDGSIYVNACRKETEEEYKARQLANEQVASAQKELQGQKELIINVSFNDEKLPVDMFVKVVGLMESSDFRWYANSPEHIQMEYMNAIVKGDIANLLSIAGVLRKQTIFDLVDVYKASPTVFRYLIKLFEIKSRIELRDSNYTRNSLEDWEEKP